MCFFRWDVSDKKCTTRPCAGDGTPRGRQQEAASRDGKDREEGTVKSAGAAQHREREDAACVHARDVHNGRTHAKRKVGAGGADHREKASDTPC